MIVRYFAAARAAAGGLSSETISATTLGQMNRVLAARHGERLAAVLASSSFLVDSTACHDPHRPLPAGAVVDVLPPFAGG
ncbi:MoaD/ThiS family protein [Actinoplanes sp. NPDC048796]|uniref:MoaD/ThiS family protein n=1 Tax=unclassified Actinoplanes TaxID=2626549 RepID=UPI0033D512FF